LVNLLLENGFEVSEDGDTDGMPPIPALAMQSGHRPKAIKWVFDAKAEGGAPWGDGGGRDTAAGQWAALPDSPKAPAEVDLWLQSLGGAGLRECGPALVSHGFDCLAAIATLGPSDRDRFQVSRDSCLPLPLGMNDTSSSFPTHH
jgi:hypothetical protein